jgi:hypothetical protein
MVGRVAPAAEGFCSHSPQTPVGGECGKGSRIGVACGEIDLSSPSPLPSPPPCGEGETGGGDVNSQFACLYRACRSHGSHRSRDEPASSLRRMPRLPMWSAQSSFQAAHPPAGSPALSSRQGTYPSGDGSRNAHSRCYAAEGAVSDSDQRNASPVIHI